MQFFSAFAERILQALVRAGAVAVEGNGKALDFQFGHGRLLVD
jgi:hypothetical protein